MIYLYLYTCFIYIYYCYSSVLNINNCLTINKTYIQYEKLEFAFNYE